MKKVLLLMVAVLMVANVAMADHLGVYTDASGTSCLLSPGFTSVVTVLHKFSLGTAGSRFKVDFPLGTGFFSFVSGYTTIGALTTDLSVGYGGCQVGTVNVGSMVANLVAGTISVLKADGQPFIIYLNCNFAELEATGGNAYVAPNTGPCNEVATQASTWGQVKALYR